VFELSKPINNEVIVATIVFIIALIGIGLGVVAYYKKQIKTKH